MPRVRFLVENNVDGSSFITIGRLALKLWSKNVCFALLASMMTHDRVILRGDSASEGFLEGEGVQ